MIRFIGLILICCLTACASKKELAPAIPVPIMEFEEPIMDIGKLTKGDSKTMYFNFKNIGTKELVIDLVTACKCTELDWPRSAIAPGERGQLKVVFDSTTIEVGEVIKTVDIIANTDPIVVEAKFKVEIIAP